MNNCNYFEVIRKILQTPHFSSAFCQKCNEFLNSVVLITLCNQKKEKLKSYYSISDKNLFGWKTSSHPEMADAIQRHGCAFGCKRTSLLHRVPKRQDLLTCLSGTTEHKWYVFVLLNLYWICGTYFHYMKFLWSSGEFQRLIRTAGVFTNNQGKMRGALAPQVKKNPQN